ncbi:MAG: hypothetical protein ACYDAY_03510 [Candidatus Dormibacteria bacterium]
MGETADETRREIDELRSEVERKVVQLRSHVDQSLNLRTQVMRHPGEALVLAGLVVGAVAVPVSLLWLAGRAFGRRSPGASSGDGGPSGGAGGLARVAGRAAGTAIAGVVLRRVVELLDERDAARRTGTTQP